MTAEQEKLIEEARSVITRVTTKGFRLLQSEQVTIALLERITELEAERDAAERDRVRANDTMRTEVQQARTLAARFQQERDEAWRKGMEQAAEIVVPSRPTAGVHYILVNKKKEILAARDEGPACIFGMFYSDKQ